METVVVNIRQVFAPVGDGLLSSLPKDRGWQIINEYYDEESGNGVILLGFEGHEITKEEGKTIISYPSVISYTADLYE